MRWSRVRRAAAIIGSDDGGKLLAVWCEAKALVALYWDAIIAIAEALHRRGRLSGAECEAIWRGDSLAA